VFRRPQRTYSLFHLVAPIWDHSPEKNAGKFLVTRKCKVMRAKSHHSLKSPLCSCVRTVGRVLEAGGVATESYGSGGRVELASGVVKERGLTSGRVEAAPSVAKERENTVGSVVLAARVAKERLTTGGCVVGAACHAKERLKPDGRVTGAASCEVEKRIVALSGVEAGIAAVWWRENRLRSWQKRKAAQRKDDET
jgi:hypothetical protein